MKSLQIENVYAPGDPEKRRYSKLKVMMSAAGYYVGTTYRDPKYGDEPGTRESDYFGTSEEAQRFLDRLEANDQEALALVRMWP